ncbi:hypothetical protein E5163_00260 [Marinicauda algicola]|uniref:Uncharacterized protein n=1 Tax=Marinicauda algicola TaxID=2029849 RepID=A0A4S2H203_9PROT|nr:hypothetical protein [Marinicauda algicola]TGY89615.1 hypothetical protein E5163_00260 [Marinicauda algicola]
MRTQQRLAMAEEAGLICEYEQIMGSLRRERVCRTPEELQRARDESFRETDRLQREGTWAPDSRDPGPF